MNHREFLASLDPSVLGRLNEKQNLPGLLHLAAHIGLIALFSGWVASGAPLWYLALLPLGILMVFLFTLQHEAIHFTPFKSVWLNQITSLVIGFVLLNPAIWFRYFHLAHHRHTQDPAKDPELQGERPETLWQYIRQISGVPLWLGMSQTLWRNAVGNFDYDYVPPRAHQKIIWEGRLTLAAYFFAACASAYLGSTLLFWIWIVPIVLGQPFLRLYLMAEHGRCPFVSNMLENTRTTYTNRIVRFLAWNMPYHAEHHALPSVPFHKLPELNALLGAHLQLTSNGYVEFQRETVAGFSE